MGRSGIIAAAFRPERGRRIFLWLLVLNAVPGPGAPVPAAMAAEAQSAALLQLTVNTVDKGAARVIIRGSEILIAVDSLKAAGVTVTPSAVETIGGVDYVAARALEPGVKVDYDAANLALALTADPRLLAPSTIDLAGAAPANLEFIDSPSAFLNYGAVSTNGRTPSFLSEQGVRLGGALFDNAFSINPQGRFIRGATNLTFDNRARSTRMTLGDAVGDAGVLGGAARIGGVTYATDFALKPYFTPFPNQRFAGVVSTPSTADIYVNGRQVRSVEVPPGVFNLENLPAVSGAGNIRVVIRNAFGQAQELGAPYYLGTQLLRRGLSDFSYTAGFERDPVSTGIGSYGRAVVAARHRYGLTDRISLGGFGAADKDKAAFGGEATFGLPFGMLSLYGAGSRQGHFTDGAASAQYSYQSTRFSLGAAYTYTGPRYASLGLDRRDDRAVTRIDSFIAAPLGGYADLTFDYSHTRFRDAGLSDRAALTASARLGGRFNLSLTLAHAQVSRVPVDNSAFLAVTMALGPRTAATASVAAERRGTTEAVQIQRSLPYGEGFGYLVQGAAGAQPVNIADVQYQGRYGLYEIDVIHTPGDTQTTVSASGAIVAIGGRVLPTRPIQDSYALIRVPGVAGVTGTLSHQSVGKTDARGDLLVPNLLSYYGNALGIDDQDIPLDYSVAATERIVAPAYRGGAVVAFPVKRLQAFTGTLEVRRGDTVIVPAYGDLTVSGGGVTVDSPLGARGEFYLEGLPAGGDVTVTYEGGVCRFKMTAPASQERFVRLGKLTCAE